MPNRLILAAVLALSLASPALADPPREPARHFTAADVFNLEYASDPQISPDGKSVAYVRVSGDVMTDHFRRSIWLVDETGQSHRPLAQGLGSYSSPVWAPDGKSLAFIASEDKTSELRVFHFDTQRIATLTRLPSGASNLSWSPDGKMMAFQMFVSEPGPDAAGLPAKPEGAEWNDGVKVIAQVNYRADGEGLVENGYAQIFVLPADGGTPRQLTWQARNHDGRLSWSPDGKTLLFSADAEEGWEYNPQDYDLYSLNIASGAIKRLTSRKGPEQDPAMSPNGKQIVYTGFDDKEISYQVSDLYIANADGSNPRLLTGKFDRDVASPQWAGDGAIYFQFEDKGATKLGRIAPAGGAVTTVLSDLGGTSIDRPYTGGAFSVNKAGKIAAVTGTPQRPGDVTVLANGKSNLITALNEDLFAGKTIPTAEHISAPSSFDKRPVDAWIVRPPDFDASKKYPLLLEIHGGPHSAYGPVFAGEIQLYAAAGYVVIYSNPRGSTSYGGEFGALISHNYPSQDYDDLMSVVDAAIAMGSIDDKRLYVTGGSGGGVLTAWIVGKTDRFRAAVSAKPVINWTSFVLTSDGTNFFTRYWFTAPPWEKPEEYLRRSPLQYVGNVKTPTMLLTGEQDFRTPISEAEQFFTALKLRKVDTALVRFPGASHDLITRPSQLIAKVSYILAWFEKHRPAPAP
jgi:dipeptidyl aminopeptidase/acylaminoacyl peptidase